MRLQSKPVNENDSHMPQKDEHIQRCFYYLLAFYSEFAF